MSAAIMQRKIIHSPWIGDVEVESECELDFSAGLPGFEDHRQFVAVEIPAQRPILYLQSIQDPDVCFVALPVQLVDPRFKLSLSDDERHTIGMARDIEPAVGADVLCLALLMPSGQTVEANPESAIVVNLHNRRAIQLIPSHKPASFRLSAENGWVRIC